MVKHFRPKWLPGCQNFEHSWSKAVLVIESIGLDGYLLGYFAAPVSGPGHGCSIAFS